MFHIHCPVCVCIASVYRRLVTHYWKCKSAKKKELLYHLSGIFCLCTTNPQKRVKNESLVGPQQPIKFVKGLPEHSHTLIFGDLKTTKFSF